MQYIFEVHNLYDRNTPGEICPTVFIKDLIEVDSHCKGKEKSEKGLGYKLQKIANFLQNWVIDRYLQGFVKNVQEFFIPNRSSWPAWIVFFSEERILSPNGIMTVWGVMLSCDTATVLFLPPA
ncbi:hypothetical protein [Prevotella pectinovora]|uniref:hypothetical protein n=1 Tax=Prevotella pectinovora TaxID=1602169 RepID=UPI00307AE913